MSDLMLCQICGSAPFNDWIRGLDWTVLACKCPGSGLRFECDSEAKELAEKHWNEMQGYIARGKLLDAAPTTKGARL